MSGAEEKAGAKRSPARICVYCSSSSAVDEIYNGVARELGQRMAQAGHALVYGGCQVGTMGELAQAVKVAGGQVIGVIPRSLLQRGLAYLEADELIVAETMAERKTLMERRAEAFIALPGGLGTLDELAQVLTLKQLGLVHGPLVILNTQGFYDLLLAHFERLYAQRFAKQEYRQLYHVASTPAEALEYIAGYHENSLPGKWF
jgi:cytokinin riboside 5'-monophosphate phosphoribohydrolase